MDSRPSVVETLMDVLLEIVLAGPTIDRPH